MKRLIVLTTTVALTWLLSMTFLVTSAEAQSGGWTEAECKTAGGIWYTNTCLSKPLDVTLQVPVGELASGKIDIGAYIKNIYKFGVAAASVLAIMMIIIGGFVWLTAGGNQERVSSAKNYISGAIIGLVLALGSYGILKIVNPSLVFFAPLKIPMIKDSFFGDFCPEQVPDGQTITCKDGNTDKELKAGDAITCGMQCTIDGKPCIGKAAPGTSNLCLPMIDAQKMTLVYTLTTPLDACQSFKDDNNGKVRLPDNQTTCDKVNIALASLPNVSPAHKGFCGWADNPLIDDDTCWWCSDEDYKHYFVNNLEKVWHAYECVSLDSTSYINIIKACGLKWCKEKGYL